MTLGPPDTSLPCTWIPSPNFEPRRGGREVDLLLLHYTGVADAGEALKILTGAQSKVSCHYLVDVDGTITQMVAERERAWHAGVASWCGESDINSCSIGIEIQNAATPESLQHFPDAQMERVIALCQDILSRHAIPAKRVLAHSDVAPERKIDPGETFNWKKLADAGIGLWVNAAPPHEGGEILGPGDQGDKVLAVQQQFNSLGYKINLCGHYTEETAVVVKAFQRHWRQNRVDGLADYSTISSLEAVDIKLNS